MQALSLGVLCLFSHGISPVKKVTPTSYRSDTSFEAMNRKAPENFQIICVLMTGDCTSCTVPV